MALLEWTEEISVGVPHLDQQHQKIVCLLNELNDAMQQGTVKAEVDRVLSGLANYTAVHFKSEEQWMAEIGYPGLAGQQAEHLDLIKQVNAFREDYNAGKALLTIQLMGFLSGWVRDHILQEDMAYAVWAREHVPDKVFQNN